MTHHTWLLGTQASLENVAVARLAARGIVVSPPSSPKVDPNPNPNPNANPNPNWYRRVTTLVYIIYYYSCRHFGSGSQLPISQRPLSYD